MKAISGRELAQILERHGWRFLRAQGSHHMYGKGASRLVIPMHGHQTLKVGLQHDLMKQAGLTERDL
jgi:predicted RNA binding protein YcfA (HicA-like mRNA interferase family)